MPGPPNGIITAPYMTCLHPRLHCWPFASNLSGSCVFFLTSAFWNRGFATRETQRYSSLDIFRQLGTDDLNQHMDTVCYNRSVCSIVSMMFSGVSKSNFLLHASPLCCRKRIAHEHRVFRGVLFPVVIAIRWRSWRLCVKLCLETSVIGKELGQLVP